MTCSLSPHRIYGVDWGARDTRGHRQDRSKPWGVEGIRLSHDGKKLRYSDNLALAQKSSAYLM